MKQKLLLKVNSTGSGSLFKQPKYVVTGFFAKPTYNTMPEHACFTLQHCC